jgi:hypothetical protein
MDLKTAIIPEHAAEQMNKRGVSVAELGALLANPESVLPVREGRVVAQAVQGGYLLRVFVDVDRAPPEVVTVYRTSKIEKYRSRP